ncbi:RHS repeat domain-containing protein [Asticcacaulis endophyticus]|uniref:YD repeat-containing protein n=1 Tax=Asticcacaulis endophyticus TaxID=1395890 RepID=A0A918URM7_9CAUL|nr:RHS repeat domain-containing protein [Asticcacaulis endophyticus]GGZ30434.1 hypothetical protein GCM10011273_15880 [Asticcacaulis endophyticus]
MTRNKFRKWVIRLICLAAIAAGSVGTVAIAGTTTYKYDSLGRVIEVNYANGTKVFYYYDKAGNRTQIVKQ